jgi:hypothetical protein
MRRRILIVGLTLAATVVVASPFGTTETLFEDSFLAYAPVADVPLDPRPPAPNSVGGDPVALGVNLASERHVGETANEDEDRLVGI